MKYEPISVAPEIIKWARVRAGFTLKEAAEKFKEIGEWEDGSAAPSYPQLERMSEAFKIPVAVFFFPEPPKLPSLHESFRTLPEKEFNRLPRRIRLLVRKAKAFQIGLSELHNGKNPAKAKITDQIFFRDRISLSGSAKKVREFLGVSFDQQTRWAGADEALEEWRAAIIKSGVYVFKDKFLVDGYSGFCLYDAEFPIIYVNNSSAKTRQIFTLFHELAHLLFHTSGIDSLTDAFVDRLSMNQRAIEVACNQFAAEFLLPETLFDEEARGQTPTEDFAEELASKYNISRELVYRRFLDRGSITQAAYEKSAKKWMGQRKGGSGGNYYYSKIAYLGRGYIDLAFAKYYQNQIDEYQLADYLDEKPKNVSALEAYVSKSAQ